MSNEPIDAINENAARYAIIFAADASTEALYAWDAADASSDTRGTDAVVNLATQIGNIAEGRRKDAAAEGRDFYPVAFVEAAALALRLNPLASIDTLCEAGQRESDSIAGGPADPPVPDVLARLAAELLSLRAQGVLGPLTDEIVIDDVEYTITLDT